MSERKSRSTLRWSKPLAARLIEGDNDDRASEAYLTKREREAAYRFDDGVAYERFVARWSRRAGKVFLDWIAPSPVLARRWLRHWQLH
ncbi:hypothetical protein [Bradyrhizobium australiense]|uniref:hypothetical protein n=1 Tax=Bradyrhizobium australiense TaxID=2721161 RepID=UPI001F22CCA5|nr:hypothetical protein [Bradyrhizobium australiense]